MTGARSNQIPGYGVGMPGRAISPLSEQEIRLLEQAAGWTQEDVSILQKHAELFRREAERMVDSWRAIIAAEPHLAHFFTDPQGKADDNYKDRVKRRFVQWVVDVATREHDRAWANYQEEIGLRHTPAKKNKTDGRQTPPLVPLRYLLAFIPNMLPIRQFFVGLIEDQAELDALQTAWTKAVVLHVTLWSRPYTAQSLW